MSDERTYVDWLWRTLAERRRALDDAAELRELEELAELLDRGHSTIYGAMLPGKARAEIVGRLRPRLAAEIQTLRARGVEPPRDPDRPRLWTEYERDQRLALWQRLSDLPAAESTLGPFERLGSHGVGELRAAGFAPSSELVLVLSSTGRCVFDGETGDRLARDTEEREHAQYPAAVPGFGPLSGIHVPMMGLDGGRALPRSTPDGWQLGVLDASNQPGAWLCPPGTNVDEPNPEDGALLLRYGFEELRAAGFSASGQTLIFAEQHTLQIFGRR